jgi:putative ABC transport system permease protein
MRTIWSRIRSLLQRRAVKQDIDEELRFHVDRLTLENIASGMPRAQAAREARKRFGNFQNVRENCRELLGASTGETLVQDVQFGFRMLRRNPGLTIAILSILALAVGATTVIYSFVHAILLRSLPYESPDRIVDIRGTDKKDPTRRGTLSLTDLADWKPDVKAFSNLAYYRMDWFTLVNNGDARRMAIARVSSNFFDVLGVKPLRGRLFTPEEDVPGRGGVVLIKYGFWQRELGGRPDVIGQQLQLEGGSFTVVGIIADGLALPPDIELWIPAAEESNWFTSRRHDFFHLAIARLAPNATVQQAQAQLDAAMERLAKKFPETNTDRTALVLRLQDSRVMNARPALRLLFAAVSLVLLIACANVANLLLARAVAREREMAVRAALGAGRRRIVRQLLTESVLLGLLGGGIGFALACAGTGLLRRIAPAGIPRLQEVGIDFSVLGFALVTAVATGVLFGIVPALHCGSREPGETLKSRTSAGARRNLPRSTLVVLEVAVSVVLLAGAGLLVKSLLRLERVQMGFNPAQLLGTDLHLSYAKYPGSEERTVFYRQLLERVKAEVPGCDAAVAMYPPFGRVSHWWFVIEGRDLGPEGKYPMTGATMVSDDYFRVMGTPVLRGRTFTEHDTEQSQLVVVINEAFARKWFPNEDPIGKRMQIESPPNTKYTIIGVVADVRQLLATPVEPQTYRSHRQYSTHDPTLVVRPAAAAGSAQVARAIREAVKKTDPEMAIGEVLTFTRIIDESVAEPRFRTMLLTSLALLALALAAVGNYGVLAYTVRQRTSEIGIRVALGAQRSHVFRLIIGQGMKLALIGTGIGLVAAFALTRLMKSLLFEIEPTDLSALLGAPLLLLAVALFACWLPARRAAKIDPLVALRCE